MLEMSTERVKFREPCWPIVNFFTMRFNNGPAAAFRALLTRAPINTRIDRHQHRVCKFETQHLAQNRVCVCPRLKSLSAGGNLQTPIGVFSYPEFKI
jgi:hypothetical protein